MRFNFEWDPAKARSNRKKHGVSFELAASVFRDPRALSVFDTDYSEDEGRWITLGVAATGVILIVNHTFEVIDEEIVEIRIFSSRKATKREQKDYAE
jgi:uncharacterized DUF497 family protein